MAVDDLGADLAVFRGVPEHCAQLSTPRLEHRVVECGEEVGAAVCLAEQCAHGAAERGGECGGEPGASRGQDGPVVSVAVGAGLMAGGLAFQAWLSVAKPWGRTPLAARASVRPSTAPRWLLALTVLAPVIDIPFGILLLGQPLPALSLTVLAVTLVTRTRRHRHAVGDRRPAVTSTAVPAIVTAAESVTPDVISLRVSPSSCETGLCGSCVLPVLAGRPDHRDDILDGTERDRADLIYPCVSRSLDRRLVVDA